MCLVRVHKTSTRADFPILSSLTPTTTCSTPLSHRQLLTGLGLQQKNTKKNAPRRSTRNASCHHTNEKENTKKTRRKLEEKTFVTTKSARRLKKEISTQNECDQDSRFSFDDDEENTTSHEDNLEDWIEYVKRSTKEVDENMLTQRRARA